MRLLIIFLQKHLLVLYMVLLQSWTFTCLRGTLQGHVY
uniref:Uncharacterized protein n=1 Tax=Anguilla anguilla TaxID=7936 RepID=A0A0E9SWL7_ANGAN